MLFGYCFIEKDGEHCPSVTLESAEEVFAYVNLHKGFYPEMRITDEEDYTVVQTLDRKVVFPPEWVELEKQMEERKE